MNKSNLDNSYEDAIFLTCLIFTAAVNFKISYLGHEKITKILGDSDHPSTKASAIIPDLLAGIQIAQAMLPLIKIFLYSKNLQTTAALNHHQEKLPPEKYFYLLGLVFYAAFSAFGWQKFQAHLVRTAGPSKVLRFSDKPKKPKKLVRFKAAEDFINQDNSCAFNKTFKQE